MSCGMDRFIIYSRFKKQKPEIWIWCIEVKHFNDLDMVYSSKTLL
jgi:hypothetical protein